MNRVKLNMAGFRQLRTHPRVVADVHSRAKSVADASGDGFEVRSNGRPRNRARSTVVTVTAAAMRDPNRMVRNLDRGRG